MADATKHGVFVLLDSTLDSSLQLPKILCAIQVTFEGTMVEMREAKDGNLISWVLSEYFLDRGLRLLPGIRIVRIAVHPDYTSMGYGSRALNLLCEYYTQTSNRTDSNTIESGKGALLYSLEEIRVPKIDWIGSSFGVNVQLLNFWRRSGFTAVYLKQTHSKTTGEFSVIVIKQSSGKELWVDGLNHKFRRRFLNMAPCYYRSPVPALCLSLIHSGCSELKPDFAQRSELDGLLSPFDKKRLEGYCKGWCEINVIIDLIPALSKLFFCGTVAAELSVLQQGVLMMVGSQCKSPVDAGKELGLTLDKVEGVLLRVCDKMMKGIK